MFDPVSRVRCDPCKCACFDQSHVFFVHGVFNHTAGICLHKLKALGVDMTLLHDYVKVFNWPRSVSSNISPAGVFSKDRFQLSLQQKTLKCTASEGMSVLPVLAAFLEPVAASHHKPEARLLAQCVLLLALVIGPCLRSARGLSVPAVYLRRVEDFMSLFIRLFGTQAVTPKFHYMFHLGLYMQRLQFLPNCLVHERKHKGVKKVCQCCFQYVH